MQDSPAADLPAIFKAKDLQFTELRMATRCKTRAIEYGPDPHSQLHVKIHPWKKWTGNAGTVCRGGSSRWSEVRGRCGAHGEAGRRGYGARRG